MGYGKSNSCREIRCRRCGRLLMKGYVEAVEVKCPKCRYIQLFADDVSEIIERRLTGVK